MIKFFNYTTFIIIWLICCNAFSTEKTSVNPGNLKIYIKERHQYQLINDTLYTDSSEVTGYLEYTARQYRNKGYLTIHHDSVLIGDSISRVYFDLGKLYNWGMINRGNVSTEILKKAGINTARFRHQPISAGQITTMFDKLITWYENNGYPFASCQLKHINSSGEGITAELFVNKHKKFCVDSIIIKGDINISTSYIMQYLDIHKNDTYNEAKFSAITNRIRELRFVKTVKPHAIDFKNEEIDIYLYLENKKANHFDGIVGFLPKSEDNNKLQITGNIQLSLLNTLGKGERLNLEWEKLPASTQKLSTRFAYPYIFQSPFGIEASFSIYKQDSSYLTINPVFGIIYQMGTNNVFRVYADNKSSTLLTDNAQRSYGEYNRTIYGAGFKVSNVDYLYNPRKGYQYNVSLGYGTKTSSIPGKKQKTKSRQLETTLDAAYYQPITNNTTVKIRAQAGYMQSFGKNTSLNETPLNELFENELFRIGGMTSLRGFNKDAIFASMYIIPSLEYRYLFNNNSAVYLFCDGAYYEKKVTRPYTYDYPFGFGAGLTFETGAGIFSITYALGKQFSNPIDIQTGKFHFGFINTF